MQAEPGTLSTKHTSIHQFVNPSAIHNPLTILAQSIDQRAGEYRTRAAPPLSHDTCSPTLYRNLTVSTLNILHVCYPVTIQTQSVIPVQSHRNCSTNVPENIELGQHCGVIIERKLFISPKSKHRSSCLAHKNGQRSEKEWSITVTSQTPHDS